MTTTKLEDIPLFTTTASSSGTCTLRDGKTLSYEIHGTGSQRIVLIMGLLASRYSWRDTLEYLTSLPGDEYSILVYDNRGAGLSSAPWGRYTTGMMALDAVDLLDHLDWKEDRSLHLNGISMGGMIAMELALIAGERFKSLTLTSTCAKHQDPPRTRAESMVNWINFFRPKFTNEAKAKAMMNVLFVDETWLNSKRQDGLTNGEWIYRVSLSRIEKAPAPPLSGRIGQTAACLTHNCSFASLLRIGKTIPDVLVITGDADKLIDPKCSEDIYRELSDRGAQKTARKIVFAGKGHALPAEAREEYHTEFIATMNAGTKRWSK